MKKITIFLIAIFISVTSFSQVTEINDLTDGRTFNSSIYLGGSTGWGATGSSNIGIGSGTLPISSGANNIGIGISSLGGNTTGSYNIGIGTASLNRNETGFYNTAVGYSSMLFNISGSNNAAFGRNALYSNTNGSYNVAIGTDALLVLSSGSNNTSLGYRAGYVANGSNNTIIGSKSGYNSTGANNVFLGYKSGYYEYGSNKLYIENSNANNDNALIYGEFDNDMLRINGNLEVNHDNGGIEGNGFKINNTANNRHWRLYTTSSYSGDLRFYSSKNGYHIAGWFEGQSGEHHAISDRSLKTNFKDLHFNWTNFMKLNTLTYNFNIQKDKSKIYIGLIAQEVKKIYPELVSYSEEDKIYGMNYAGFGIVAIKAIQELKTEVDVLSKENKTLKEKLSKLELLEKRIKALEENGFYTVFNK